MLSLIQERIVFSFSLVILLVLVLRKSSKASLASVLNAGIAVAVLGAGGGWIVVIVVIAKKVAELLLFCRKQEVAELLLFRKNSI